LEIKSRKGKNGIDIVSVHHYYIHMYLPDGTIRHRRKSIDLSNHAHELTFSCYNGYKLLSKDKTRQWLVDSLDRARRKHHLQLWAYVLMPEHCHVVVLPERSEYQTSWILETIKKGVARRALNFLKRKGPSSWLERLTARHPSGEIERHFWQPGGGYDRNIVTMAALVGAVHYIHANPVRRGLVAQPTDWEWSSARWYEGETDVRLKMDATMPQLIV
jgi:putative transposase